MVFPQNMQQNHSTQCNGEFLRAQYPEFTQMVTLHSQNRMGGWASFRHTQNQRNNLKYKLQLKLHDLGPKPPLTEQRMFPADTKKTGYFLRVPILRGTIKEGL